MLYVVDGKLWDGHYSKDLMNSLIGRTGMLLPDRKPLPNLSMFWSYINYITNTGYPELQLPIFCDWPRASNIRVILCSLLLPFRCKAGRTAAGRDRTISRGAWYPSAYEWWPLSTPLDNADSPVYVTVRTQWQENVSFICRLLMDSAYCPALFRPTSYIVYTAGFSRLIERWTLA